MGIHPFTIGLFCLLTALGAGLSVHFEQKLLAVVGVALGTFVILAMRVAHQWQRAVILRLGKFHRLSGPGVIGMIPLVETAPYWIDLRTITTPFTAEQTLSRDSVPVDVDAVLFWKVVDPEKAALEVEDYRQAIAWAAQTALRDVIGETDLSDILAGRQNIDKRLTKIIDDRTEAWGIKAIAVEMRDVKIPTALQSAMSQQAQAERERQARVILSESEVQVAAKFKEAAVSYAENPVALQLRAMNILLEGMRNNATVIIVPSSAVETMGLGTSMGMAALAKGVASGSQAAPKAGS